MLGIKLKGVFLDLKPGTSTEIDRKSPFFAINDYASEGTTEPIAFKYSPKNALALELPYQYYTARKKKKYQVEYYSGNSFLYRCTLIIETGKLNLNNIEDTEISGYLLYSISNFFQDIKGKKLSDLKLGGIRSFNWTTNNPDDGSNGFWQHIHASWVDPSIPYVFQPIRNEAYYGESSDVDWMNKLNDQAKLLYNFNYPLVPIPRLKYLLEQIFVEIGFSIDFSGLNDVDWERLLLVNLVEVEWTAVGPVVNSSGQSEYVEGPATVTKIDLKRHVPQDKTISDFILQLFGKYGWAPLFDGATRKCRLVAAKEAGNGKVKDWTKYAAPLIETNFSEDPKIFAFTNDIDSNDQLPAAPELDNLNITPGAIYARFLPVPTPSMEGMVTYCYQDNQWWQVQLDEDSNEYEWKFFADNIYNDEPKGNTDTISSTISTLPSYLTEYRTEGGVTYSGYFPAMKQEATKNIGYRTLLYHGMVPELALNGSGLGAPRLYPHASATRLDPIAANPLAWSNVYLHKKFADTNFEEDFGIKKYWWSRFLDILQAGEEIVVNVKLPLHELTQFAWDDKILISNIPYLVKEFLEPVPYRDGSYIQATLKRMMKPVPLAIVDDNNNPVSGIYARLVVTQVRQEDYVFNLKMNYSDVKVFLYSDASGNIPYTPPSEMYVWVQADLVNNNSGGGGTPSGTTHKYYPVNAASTTILHDTFTKAFYSTSGNVLAEMTYSLDPAGANGYEVI